MDKDTAPISLNTDPLPSGDEGAPLRVKSTIVGPAARVREAATGDPLPNPSHAKLAAGMTGAKDSWIRALSDVRVSMSDDEARRYSDILSLIDRSDLSTDQKMAEIKRLDPHDEFAKMAIERGDADLKARKSDLAKQEKLIRSLSLYIEWEKKETAKFVLQKNECSRLHKLAEAMNAGLFYDGEAGQFLYADPSGTTLEDARVFVVRHDWAAAFGEDSSMLAPDQPFRLPAPHCVFEFRVDGHTVLMDCKENHLGYQIASCVMAEGVEGVWFDLGGTAMADIHAFCDRQVRAICIALEAQVAEHQVMRAPAKLNLKRAKDNKPPLRDFHIVDLARRIKMRSRAEPRPDAQPTGRRVRLHFRRGHWRHYESHTTWIEWMLVGDPDLGFIDKHYRI